MDLAELLTVETSVLRTLCLTVNSESSELKTRITENLIVDDFYFPITKSIFGAISDLAKNGTNVDPNSLEKALSRRSIDVPDGFFSRGSVPRRGALAANSDGVDRWPEQPEERQR